jgi:hypothetical protein
MIKLDFFSKKSTKASSKEEAFFVLFTSKKVKLFLQLTVQFAF